MDGKEVLLYQEIFKNPSSASVRNFSQYIAQELSSGHVAQLSHCLKNLTIAVDNIKEEDNALDKLFNLDLHLTFSQILESLVHDDVVCTPDAVESLLSLFGLLSAACGKSQIGKDKLSLLVPALVHDVIVNQKRGIPMRLEAVKLANAILGDVVNDRVNLAFQDLQDNFEHILVSAGDFELQAGIVELFFRVVPFHVREAQAHEYFRNSVVSQAFMEITSLEFEAGCRDFLNTLNASQGESRSVFSLPCHSARFGRAEVQQPKDDKITDFWIDFNIGWKSISLFVEEVRDCSYQGIGTWETVLIKADDVADYRVMGTDAGYVALLLKLNHAASELVTFLSRDDNQYIKFTFDGKHTRSLTCVSKKILGNPKVQNVSGGESDASLTPSTKVSVAINPVYISSRDRKVANVMPTASSLLSEGVTDIEEDEFVSLEEKSLHGNKNSIKHQEALSDQQGNGKKGEDSRKRDQSKTNASDDEYKSDNSRKSLPSAFNVGKRLLAKTKRAKFSDEPRSSAVTTRKAIKKKVFSKASPTFVKRSEKPLKSTSKLRILNPERRREPRSGDVSVIGRCKDNTEERVDVVQDSLPLADNEDTLPVSPVTKARDDNNLQSILENNRASHKQSKEGGSEQDNDDSDEVTECYIEDGSPPRTSPEKTTLNSKYGVKMRRMGDDTGYFAKHHFPEAVFYERGITREEGNPDIHSKDARRKSTSKRTLKNSKDGKEYMFLQEMVALQEKFSNEESGMNSEEEDEQLLEKKSDRVLKRRFAGRPHSLKQSRSLDDSGIGDTPFGTKGKWKMSSSGREPNSREGRSKFWRTNQLHISLVGSPIKPRTGQQKPHLKKGQSHNLENMSHDSNLIDVETDEESGLSHGSQQQSVKTWQRGKRKFVDWSTSGRSAFYKNNWDKTDCEMSFMNETLDQTDRQSQRSYKPRKLSYEYIPNFETEEDDINSVEEEIRREIEGLISQARGDIIKAVQRKRFIIQTFQRTHDSVFNTIDSFWTRQKNASYNVLEKYKYQLSDQVQALEKDMEKTFKIVREMEKTFDLLVEQSKILVSQREVEQERFTSLQHLQESLENDLTKLERRRNEEEVSLRLGLEEEMARLQKKILQDMQMHEKEHLKMLLFTLRIP